MEVFSRKHDSDSRTVDGRLGRSESRHRNLLFDSLLSEDVGRGFLTEMTHTSLGGESGFEGDSRG